MKKQDINKLNKIVDRFGNAMKKKDVPFYTVGRLNRRNKPNVLEIVVKRPARYNNPSVLKKIPKTFEGLKVIVA